MIQHLTTTTRLGYPFSRLKSVNNRERGPETTVNGRRTACLASVTSNLTTYNQNLVGLQPCGLLLTALEVVCTLKCTKHVHVVHTKDIQTFKNLLCVRSFVMKEGGTTERRKEDCCSDSEVQIADLSFPTSQGAGHKFETSHSYR